MLDTMVFDALHADPAGREAVLEAVRAGELLLCTTHVQEDQLAAIPNPVRRKALQRLPRHVVPASAGVAGVFRTGRVRFTDDEAGDALRYGSRHAPGRPHRRSRRDPHGRPRHRGPPADPGHA